MLEKNQKLWCCTDYSDYPPDVAIGTLKELALDSVESYLLGWNDWRAFADLEEEILEYKKEHISKFNSLGFREDKKWLEIFINELLENEEYEKILCLTGWDSSYTSFEQLIENSPLLVSKTWRINKND
jgi:hypothetical protein